MTDALSRKLVHDSECSVVSSASPQWMEAVAASYLGDDATKTLLTKLSIAPKSIQHFTLVDGVIRHKGRIWVGNDPVLQNKLIQALHSSAVGGHSSIPVTLRKLKQLFSWKGMKLMVHSFVRSCSVCQQAKPDRSRLPGLLQPLSVPTTAWQIVSLDFVEGLPKWKASKSGIVNCVLVVVDTFTKYAHFLALSHPFSALTVAKLYINQVYRLHGLPQKLISDRDKIFTSQLWQELFRLTNVQLNISSSCHPQTDGQTEHVNQCFEHFFAVSCRLVHLNGAVGCRWLNSGIIQVITLLLTQHRLKLCMAISPSTLAYLLMMSATTQTYLPSCKKNRSCISWFSNT